MILASMFPCILEWKFDEGERVVVFSSGKQGVVKAIGSNYVGVDLATREGLVNVPWSNLRKYIVAGDFVEIRSGAYQEEKGWVIGVEGKVVVMLENMAVEKLVNATVDEKVSCTSVFIASHKLASRCLKFMSTG